jgi:hypothetical protein
MGGVRGKGLGLGLWSTLSWLQLNVKYISYQIKICKRTQHERWITDINTDPIGKVAS